ncbi:hypothetical protein ACF0H5_005623 [Mactra antiquata]
MKMMSKVHFMFLVCVLALISEHQIVLCFKRDLQKQLSKLEKRYELDFTLIQEDIEELWIAVEQVDINRKQPLNTSTKAIHGPTVATSAVNRETCAVAIRSMKVAFSEEKKYLREETDELRNEINKQGVRWQNNFKNLSDSDNEIQSVCKDLESDITRMKERVENLDERLTKLDTDTLRHTSDLSSLLDSLSNQINQIVALNRPESCMELIRAGITSSGVYELYFKNQPFTVFCLMMEKHGYTFISPETYMKVDINKLSNDKGHVIIRHRRTNGHQYHTRIEQLSRYTNRDISVQYESHVGYQGMKNSKLSPYIYIGINPLGGSQRGQRQGYRSNGKNIEFTNCDGNPNGYFVFLFNHAEVPLHNHGYSPAIARQWIDTSTLVTTDKIPIKFMSKFELHFGGCGAYATSDHFGDVIKAAVGIPYKM